jgi:CRISPR-associated endonuclease Csn1
MATVLGLDVGPNSIGWALLEDNIENPHIIDMGVRVFEAGVNDLNTGKEQSKNAARREKKQIRKMLRRKRSRRNKLLLYLQQNKLLSEVDLEIFFNNTNPYELRRKAIYEQVSLDEFSRALYHICQRRGFLSNRKTDSDEETGAIYQGGKSGATGITELQQGIEEGGFLTLGEYLCSLDPKEKRLRNRYTLRKMYQNEFDIIWTKQSEFYPDILTEEHRKYIRDVIIFFQRPLQSQKKNVGKCKFEKDKNNPKWGKNRCHLSSFEFQEFRMLQQVNQLRIRMKNRFGEDAEQLTYNEREKLINYLSTNTELKFGDNYKKLKKVLGIEEGAWLRINLEHLDKLIGLRTKYAFQKLLGKKFDTFSNDQIQAMYHTLLFAESNEWLIEYAQKKWNLTEKEANAYSKIKLEKGYGSLSIKAINKMLPFLREGLLYDKAAAKAGYEHNLFEDQDKVEIKDKLPEPEKVANPIVMTALYEIRKVVNCLIEHYKFKPDVVRLEMARDLKIPLQKRLDIASDNKKRQLEHERITNIIKTEFPNIAYPSRKDIIKYKLWEECKHTCPYTGRPIGLNQLFGDAIEFEVEHIIPYSRCLDDSFMNKTLCYRKENLYKGKRTPYEAYNDNKLKYNEILQRVNEFPNRKANKFKEKEIALLDDFISTQLNDTRYISKIAKQYLRHITPEVNVGNGTITALLRHLWGMNSVLKNPFLNLEFNSPDKSEKNRSDHRHHAIDAVAIACTTRSIFQKLSSLHNEFDLQYLETREKAEYLDKEKFPFPWEGFRDEVKKMAARIIVSHRFKYKVSGPTHEETLYGKLYNIDGSERLNKKGVPLYTVRKPLTSLTENEILSIADPVVREVVLERIMEFGGKIDAKGKLVSLSKEAFKEPIYLPNPVKGYPNVINKVRVLKQFSNPIQIRDYNIWVESGNNHHSIIYSDETGKLGEKVTTLYNAYSRRKDKEKVIENELGPNNEIILSLMRNEMFLIGDIPIGIDYNDKFLYKILFESIYRLQKFSEMYYVFRNHSISILDTKDADGKKIEPGLARYQSLNSFIEKNITKIVVDPIGFIRIPENH